MNPIYRFFNYFLLTVVISACSSSQFMLDRGKQSYQAQDYRQAFLRLLPVAKAGNPDAQYAIAYMYYYGQGVVEDRKKASKWMKRAAAQNQADAIEGLKLIQHLPKSPYQPSEDPKKRPW